MLKFIHVEKEKSASNYVNVPWFPLMLTDAQKEVEWDIYDAVELTIESAERMNKYNGEEKLCRF